MAEITLPPFTIQGESERSIFDMLIVSYGAACASGNPVLAQMAKAAVGHVFNLVLPIEATPQPSPPET